MLKQAADRPVVIITLAITLVDFALYLTVSNTWLLAAYAAMMLVPKGILGAWNHHHQHCFMFRSNFMNRVLEMSFGLHSGTAPFLWVLHHDFGHHINFLDQKKDESRWQRSNGERMGMLEYTLNVALTAYPRALGVGRRYPQLRNQFVFYGLLLLAIVGTLVWHKPVAGLLLFAAPMVAGLLFVAWVTFDHHSGLYTTNEFEASHNTIHPWFNALTGNLGYHTAHHHRPGLHWSQLPQLHERIKDKIPEHCYRRSSFHIFFPPDDSQIASEFVAARNAREST